MLLRASLVLLAMGASGCLQHAKLTSAREAVETFNAPVTCGPMGFRRVPLAARFGEYVRLTVHSPVPLAGSVMVHANGVAHPARAWTSDGDGLVVEARFENTDPDLPSALRATQPIDVTIGELTAPEGGSCDGAVFTLEHGRLVAPTSDALWVAELERRGGAALAARREARRRMNAEELARATESAQPEFSTVLAGWAEAEGTQNVSVAQVNLEGVTVQTSIAQAAESAARGGPGAPASNVAVAQVNLDGAPAAQNGSAPASNVAVAQVHLDGVPAAQNASAPASNVAVAQVNLDGVPAAQNGSAPAASGGSASNVAVAQVNLGAPIGHTEVTFDEYPRGAATASENVAIAQVNIGASQAAPDFAHGNNPVAYDDATAHRRTAQLEAPPLPSVGAMFPPGCTGLWCVVPAPQCTQGCTPAPGSCTASTCTVNDAHVEFAVFPRGCVTASCAMPISQCTGACTRAPGAFINGVYACGSVSTGNTTVAVDTDWREVPVSVTAQVAYQTPRPAPLPPEEVEVEVIPTLSWLLGAALSLPAPVQVVAPPPRYVPAPRYVPVHGARPVGAGR